MTTSSYSENRAKWDRRFLELAAQIGSWSKDRSAKIGCVFVGSDKIIRATGYNGFARGLDDEVTSRHARPDKYSWTEHAERNAIYNATRLGVSLTDSICYVNWFPCVDCARGIIQVGAKRLVGLRPDTNDAKWGNDFNIAREMFDELNLEVTLLDFPHLLARANISS